MISGFDKYVGVEPYTNTAIETKTEGTKRQFSYMVSKNLLVPLTVVYPNLAASIWPGDRVFVRHEDLVGNATWSKSFDVEGQTTVVDGKEQPRRIMILPLDRIVLVERAETK